jgi:FlaA1/EpsC-like NDP-sugar epimerase
MSNKTIPLLLLATDSLLGIGAFLLSVYLLSGTMNGYPGLPVILLSGAVVNAGFVGFRLYSEYSLRNATQQLMNIGKGIALSILFIISLSYFFNITIVLDNPLLVVYFAAIGFVSIQLWRTFVMRPLYMYFANRNLKLKNTMIIGADYIGQMMAAKIDLHRLNGMHVVGFLDDDLDMSINVFKDKKVLGRMKDVGTIIDAHNIDEVLYCFDNGNYSIFQEILEICNRKNIKMRIASPYFDVLSPGMNAEKIGISVSYDFYPYQSNLHYTVKRIVDVVLATLGLIVLAPLFLIIALAIKIDSPGSIFYIHTRLGKRLMSPRTARRAVLQVVGNAVG